MENKFIVETSARHVHLTAETVETLFGKGHTLTNKKDLSQPGQFACEEKVTVKGEKGELKMSVLGPARKESQVEISLTDAIITSATVKPAPMPKPSAILRSGPFLDAKDSALARIIQFTTIRGINAPSAEERSGRYA